MRTGLLAACSRPGMAPRRRHLCFFRRANPTFPPGPGLPAPRRRPGPLPGSLGSPAGHPAGPAAAPRARHAPQTAPRTAGAPAHFPFAGGWPCGALEPRCGKPPVAKLPPGATRDPAPGPRRCPPARRSGWKAAPTNTRCPELGDSQPGRAGTGGRGRSPRVRSPLGGHPTIGPPAPLPLLSPWGPPEQTFPGRVGRALSNFVPSPSSACSPPARPLTSAWRFPPEAEPPVLPGTPEGMRRGLPGLLLSSKTPTSPVYPNRGFIYMPLSAWEFRSLRGRTLLSLPLRHIRGSSPPPRAP